MPFSAKLAALAFATENLPAEMLDTNIRSLEKPTALIRQTQAAQTMGGLPK